jgi:hypothetical protein
MRKNGKYKVIYKGEQRTAKYVTNQDHDSSWCCWWIEGEELKAWGWSDNELDEILEFIEE